mgnify:CR=1 FL=1
MDLEKDDLTQHISRQYNEDLEQIRTNVLNMGGLVEKHLGDALRALLEQDSKLADEVALSDYLVNNLEVEIDEECTRVLVRRQPAAGDLRVVIMIIKTITDLERVGDQAKRIAKFAANLDDGSATRRFQSEIANMAERVRKMLRGALDAFARLDTDLAYEIACMEPKVDREFENLTRLLMTYMMEDPRSIKWTVQIMWAARSMERISDYCQNICEYVIYMVKGKDVRHTSLESIEKEIHEDRHLGRNPEGG